MKLIVDYYLIVVLLFASLFSFLLSEIIKNNSLIFKFILHFGFILFFSFLSPFIYWKLSMMEDPTNSVGLEGISITFFIVITIFVSYMVGLLVYLFKHRSFLFKK